MLFQLYTQYSLQIGVNGENWAIKKNEHDITLVIAIGFEPTNAEGDIRVSSGIVWGIDKVSR